MLGGYAHPGGVAMIPEDQMEAFYVELRRRGRDPADFNVEQQPHPPEATAQPGGTATIRVEHVPSGVERRYTGGAGTSWVVRFSDDLDAEVFPP